MINLAKACNESRGLWAWLKGKQPTPAMIARFDALGASLLAQADGAGPRVAAVDWLSRALLVSPLRGADLAGACLAGACLRGADLRGADLVGADLTRAYLTRADLAGAYLRGADLRGADLRGADLAGARLDTSLKGV